MAEGSASRFRLTAFERTRLDIGMWDYTVGMGVNYIKNDLKKKVNSRCIV